MTTNRSPGVFTALSIVLITVFVCSPTSRIALAQAPAAPAPAPAAAPALPPGPPQAPAELEQIKWLEGNWRCDGKAPAGPMGPEHRYKSTMKIKRDLDGFWFVGEYEQKKTKDNPMAIKARSFTGFDPVAKKVVSLGVDNVGGALELSGAIEGDKITTVGEGSMGGQKIGFKEVYTRTGDKALTWHGELRLGKDWIVVGDDTCKR